MNQKISATKKTPPLDATPCTNNGISQPAPHRGFTVAEKWVMWVVFCLLVGLSSQILIFPSLLLLSYGIVLLRGAVITRKFSPNVWIAIGACAASAILVLWAFR